MTKTEVKDHNEMYAALQDRYLATGDIQALSSMYGIAQRMAVNYIRLYCKRHHICHLDIQQLAHDAAAYVIEKNVEGYGPVARRRRAEKSQEIFGFAQDENTSYRYVKRLSAYMYLGVKKILFSDREREEKEVLFCDYYKDDYNE